MAAIAARAAAVALLAMLLGGCAITSSSAHGPNGRPVMYIDATSAGVAFNKAASRCPNGYIILGEPRQESPVDYTMTVECK